MHLSGSRRALMSLLQNFMLRNSIDKNLRQSKGTITMAASSYACNPIRSVSTSMTSGNEGKRDNGSIPPEPALDPDSLQKLNELKQGLQAKNEYFEKYKAKLTKIETESPRELLARLEQLDDSKKDQIKRMRTAEKALRKPRSLNDVMHMDSLRNLDRIDIIHLWQEFHRHKEGLLGAVMSSSVYEKMSDLASIHKMFVMPLPRSDGYEFFFMQFEDNTFHFTPLIMYQTHQDTAPVALRLINYTDLKSEKDLVLLRGEYDAKIMKAEDAHFLAVQTNFYFGETNETRLGLLNKFTNQPDEFKHMELIDELKRIQETHAQLFEFEPTNKSSSA